MKILQIHNFYMIPGGECSVVRAEKRLLESRGHEVVQFAYDSGDIEDYSWARKSVAFAQIPYNIQASRKLSRFLEKNEPDIAHVHNVFPLLSPSVYVTLKRHGIPVVQTVHNYRFLCPNGFFYTQGRICEDCMQRGFISAVRKRCMRDSAGVSLLYASAIWYARKSGNIFRNIDRFIALNRFSADKLTAGGVPGGKIRVCGNFVEKFFDAPSPKKSYILYLGRLSVEKGLRTLFTALRKVPGVRLKLAGIGPLEQELRGYVDANPGMDVEFIGYVKGDDKERQVREAICTVMPSEWYENFPISVAESLAMGTPVVASRIGGLPEMIEHEQTGLLFTPGDAEELARCINRLVMNKATTERLAKNAVDSAARLFSAEVHYRQLMEIFREISPGELPVEVKS